MKKKIIIIGSIVILAAAGAYYYFSVPKAAPIEWRTTRVEQGDVRVVVTATGTLSAVTTVQVGTQVSGTIASLAADFNTRVAKGQVIARLDPTFLNAAVQDAQAGFEKAAVQTRLTKRDFDRAKLLFDRKLIAQSDFDITQSAYESAIAAQTSAQAQLDRAKINLTYAIIRAPISGVVIARSVDVGQTVAASFSTPTLFSIAQDLTKMQVLASVDESDIGKIKSGQHVKFTVDAYPSTTFDGEISQVRLQPVVANNVVDYTVVVNVPNDDLKLMPGMTANITVAIESHSNVLKVATGALRFSPPREYFATMSDQLPDSIKAKMKERGNRGGGNGGAPEGGGQRRPGEGGPGGPGKQVELVAGGMGRLWVKSGDHLKPMKVQLGLSDGTFTEISADSLAAGTEVVIGVLNQPSSATPQQNPFSPQGGGGGPRRF
jgi:HlyD family secretion protein